MSDCKNHGSCPNFELNPEQIKDRFIELNNNWQLRSKPNRLVKEFKFKDFKGALKFTNQLGNLAEVENHHPDILLSWSLVRVEFWTHNAGGLTELDFLLANKTDGLVQ